MKKISFKAEDGQSYNVNVTPIKFNDNGTNRLKFQVEDMVSKGVLQRINRNWVLLEGDIKPSHVPFIGEAIRLSFDT